MSDSLNDLTLFITDEHPCSYLADQQACTLFVDPQYNLSPAQYTQLSQLGFRRSGLYIYKPHCKHCTACITARINCHQFNANRQQKRIIKRNADLHVGQVSPHFTQEHYQLYERYINLRHAGGDMYPATQEQYCNFLVNGPSHCFFYEFRLNQQLLVVAVTDHFSDGLSAVYTFFDPDCGQRSLGQYAILWQINHCLNIGLQKLYLGYWIKACQKMNYKLQYRPIELLINNKWTLLN